MENQKNEKYYCTKCNKDVSETDLICPHCGADVSEVEENQNTIPNIFKGAALYGSILEGIGWFFIIFGIFVTLYILFISSGIFGIVISIIICAGLLLFGLQFVALGQGIQCHVQIEMNTRLTHLFLKRIYEQEKEKHIIVKMKS